MKYDTTFQKDEDLYYHRMICKKKQFLKNELQH